jgi:hypothetical protein
MLHCSGLCAVTLGVIAVNSACEALAAEALGHILMCRSMEYAFIFLLCLLLQHLRYRIKRYQGGLKPCDGGTVS